MRPEAVVPERNAAALEVERKTHAMEELGPIAREPRARERLEVEVRQAETQLEVARDAEARARARVEANVIDAEDVVLGRLAVTAATLLRGKHKPTYAPHVDGGDFVIVVNASKVALTGNKRTNKLAYRHSGRPGGLKTVSYGELLDSDPRQAVEKAVWGMLPKNKLSRKVISKLKVYAGPEHPHAAQRPQPYEITQVSQ